MIDLTNIWLYRLHVTKLLDAKSKHTLFCLLMHYCLCSYINNNALVKKNSVCLLFASNNFVTCNIC